METIQNSSSLPRALQPADLQKAQSQKAKDAAKAFESLFTSMMVKSMRNAIPQGNDEFLPTSFGEKMYTEMLDEQYSGMISKNGNLGLADLILKQIGNTKDQSSYLSMLKGLKTEPWSLDKAFIPSKTGSVGAVQHSMDQWQPIIKEASEKYGVDPSLITAVIAQESGGNPIAVSNRGAKGLMQLMDSTAQDLGVKQVFHPRDNVLGGTKYLRQLLDKYNQNESLALASYNAGPAAVDKYNGVPPYPETQQYVDSVKVLQQKYSEKTAPNY